LTPPSPPWKIPLILLIFLFNPSLRHLLAEGKLRFTVFQAVMDSSVVVADGDDHPLQTAVGVVTEQPDGAQETNLVTYLGEDICSGDQKQKFYSVQVVRNEDSGVVTEILCDKYTSMALSYLYRKRTMEVKHLCKDKQIEKIDVEKEGILLSRGRKLDDMNLTLTLKAW
jgi:hypothetical protein